MILHRRLATLISIVLLSLATTLPIRATDLKLEILPNNTTLLQGAACLDGSPPAIYFTPATSPSAATKWVLYIKGGGWCVNNEECLTRATTSLLGSSTQLQAVQPTFSYGGSGPLGDSKLLNPVFSSFNKVLLWYCDGGSFTGDRTTPVPVNHTATKVTHNVYYRGKRNLDAMLMYLRQQHQLDQATDILLSGGSAGALAVYLHADYIRSTFSPLVKFRAAPISGFFLMHNTINGTNLFPKRNTHVFNMMNSSGGVNQQCISALTKISSRNVSECFFANTSYAYTTTSIFVLNSAVDSFQMEDILATPVACAGFAAAKVRPQFSNCSVSELESIKQYEHDFLFDLQRSSNYRRLGNGGFVESCLEHVAAQGSRSNAITNGNVSMMQALSEWWLANATTPAKWYLPCDIHATHPGQCNPSCSIFPPPTATPATPATSATGPPT